MGGGKDKHDETDKGLFSHGHYPPHGYPPAQYPPGAGGYPPQVYPPAGYPPQQGGYPSSGYPTAGYPPSGYPPRQGYPPSGGYPGQHHSGLIGKVAADHSHKWIHKEPNDQEINFLSAWHNSADSHPRTWEAQFQSGIKTIALIAVREGVIQLGAVHKVVEDLSYIVLLRKKLSYIESIPGVLLPHPSSSAFPFKNEAYPPESAWHFQNKLIPPHEFYDQFSHHHPMRIAPSMSSLEALLSKLPSVEPQNHYSPATRPVELTAKEEYDDDEDRNDGGESTAHGQRYSYQHDLNQC